MHATASASMHARATTCAFMRACAMVNAPMHAFAKKRVPYCHAHSVIWCGDSNPHRPKSALAAPEKSP
eukprot:357901-Chlamydomonas_euryale.AAC.1